MYKLREFIEGINSSEKIYCTNSTERIYLSQSIFTKMSLIWLILPTSVPYFLESMTRFHYFALSSLSMLVQDNLHTKNSVEASHCQTSSKTRRTVSKYLSDRLRDLKVLNILKLFTYVCSKHAFLMKFSLSWTFVFFWLLVCCYAIAISKNWQNPIVSKNVLLAISRKKGPRMELQLRMLLSDLSDCSIF